MEGRRSKGERDGSVGEQVDGKRPGCASIK